MKVFALLGLVCAVNGANTVRRRRLALLKCKFSEAQAVAHDPNCLGKWKWDMDEAKRESKDPALTHHDYRCCFEEELGWKDAGAKQQKCAKYTAVPSQCADIKKYDDDCRAADKKTTSFFSPGYSTTTCGSGTGYADDCRANVQCNTAAGFTGTADLACEQDHNSEFLLRGCVRGDLGTVGTTKTTDVFVVRPHSVPVQDGNPKTSYAECASTAVSTGSTAMVAGNGGCDDRNFCHKPDICAIFDSTFDGKFDVSESEDTYLRPFTYKSQINERCIKNPNANPALWSGVSPTGSEEEVDCTGNLKSNDNTASYGGFDEYGDRFSCWRNLGGGIGNVAFNLFMTALDLTYEVFHATANEGIGMTLKEFFGNPAQFGDAGNVPKPWGVWNSALGANGNGYGVCTGVSAALGGCTAELAALMCEAYNREIVAAGAEDTSKHCMGFTLQESDPATTTKVLGAWPLNPAAPVGYSEKTDRDMLVGFFSAAGKDDRWLAGHPLFWNWNGGYFKYVPVANCLVTSSHDCSKCAKCKKTHVLATDLTCVTACPKFQYSKDGVCTYRAAHCLEGPATGADDGTTCGKCRDNYLLSTDKTTCEEKGCEVPASMKSDANDALTGAEQGVTPACVAGQNIVPLGACGIQCPDGKFSSNSAKTVTYSCPVTGLAKPTIVCSDCGVAKCDRCPSNPNCDQCNSGHFLSSDKKTCTAKPCLYIKPPATSVDPADDTAGDCKKCPYGTAGALAWDVVSETWSTTACETCAVDNCLDCVGDKAKCQTCADGYAIEDTGKTKCKLLDLCPYGKTGKVKWDVVKAEMDDSDCATDVNTCEDPSQTKGACTDCKDGWVGSVDWNFGTQKWDTSQCTIVACPVPTESSPDCNSCPAFQAGSPKWDDLFNEWTGCVANDFGFSFGASAAASASWATVGEVEVADLQLMEMFHVTETKTAETLHIANAQFDTIRDKWVCDEGFAGDACQERMCPETVAFTSGTDGGTPSLSHGVVWTTDAGKGTSSTFNNQHSYRECGGRGTCDYETAICQCFPGFTGVGCRRTTCPNGCSGHGVCMNDNVANYAAAGGGNVPDKTHKDINTWGNLWSADKFQGCRCDGGWGGNDCSLRQCPRGDDPETECTDDLGNDVQYITCTNLFAKHEAFFKLRFTDVLGNRYNTRSIVLREHPAELAAANKDELGLAYTQQASSSIQTALESLPNFVIPRVEVTATPSVPVWACIFPGTNFHQCDFTKKYTLQFEVKFTDARNSGQQPILELVSDMKCASGVQPKFPSPDDAANIFDPQCTITRMPKDDSNYIDLRENAECSNRGLCNRKTAECNCFDGYTGLACETVAQTY